MIRDVLLGIEVGVPVIGKATILKTIIGNSDATIDEERRGTVYFDSRNIDNENENDGNDGDVGGDGDIVDNLNESGYMTAIERDDVLGDNDNDNDERSNDDLLSNHKLMQIYRTCNNACKHVYKDKQGETPMKALKSMQKKRNLKNWSLKNENAFIRLWEWRSRVSRDEVKCLRR